MENADIEKLAGSIRRCFRLSRDGRLSYQTRREYLGEGIRLREKLAPLLAAELDSSTSLYQQASSELEDVSDRLRDDSRAIDQAADTIESIKALVATLDVLLDIATSFV